MLKTILAAALCFAAPAVGAAAEDGADADRARSNLFGVDRATLNKPNTRFRWPEKTGDAVVCLWKDDRIGAVTLTIDDNTRPDHDWWLEQQDKYGFRFTWFVVTSGIDGKNKFNGTWDGFGELVRRGHDVQSHTMTHNLKKENVVDGAYERQYRDSRDLIDEKIPAARCRTLAYPGGAFVNNHAEAAKYYAAARGVTGTLNTPSPNYLSVNSVSGSRSALAPLDSKKNFASVRMLLHEAPRNKYYRGWYCVHFHGVYWNAQQRDGSVPPTLALLDFLKENEEKLWVAPFREVALYGQERDTAQLATTHADEREIRLSLTDRMRDDWFDLPLTLKVRLPESWADAVAEQNGTAIPARTITHEGARYAMVDVVPDRGEAVLKAR